MLAKHQRTDAWAQTLFLLDTLSRAEQTDRNTVELLKIQPRFQPAGFDAPKGEANIRVLDRPTSRTAIVTWGDPTSCHYGDQVWRVARAARDGFCALSGQQIHRGDIVYRPSHYRPAPANAASMMLAQCVLVAPIDR
jgi:Domain of unknown function (DUF3331)